MFFSSDMGNLLQFHGGLAEEFQQSAPALVAIVT
jgi:L-ribulose-5-phosphate 3-epimerase UlaE